MTTIGVSVAIPDPWAQQLQEYRTSIGDVTASLIPTHITLVPPIEVAPEQLPAIEEHLGRVAAGTAGFRILLRGTGTFRPVSPVVFVTVAAGISNCEQLASAARSGPLATELAFPYHPHVTIGQGLDDDALDRAFAELADFQCEFEVRSFHLYIHDETAGWRPTRDFRLAPQAEVT